jgi:hypothetical protein
MRLVFTLLLMLLVACGPSPAQNGGGFPTPIGTTDPVPPPTVQPTATSIPPTPDPWTKDTVYLEKTEIRTLSDQPGLVVLYVAGQLPTPCHQASTLVCPSCVPDSTHLIQVNLYGCVSNELNRPKKREGWGMYSPHPSLFFGEPPTEMKCTQFICPDRNRARLPGADDPV